MVLILTKKEINSLIIKIRQINFDNKKYDGYDIRISPSKVLIIRKELKICCWGGWVMYIVKLYDRSLTYEVSMVGYKNLNVLSCSNARLCDVKNLSDIDTLNEIERWILEQYKQVRGRPTKIHQCGVCSGDITPTKCYIRSL